MRFCNNFLQFSFFCIANGSCVNMFYKLKALCYNNFRIKLAGMAE